MKIGNIQLTHGLILAPMAGVTDHVFRTICKSSGAEYMFSEMVSAKALCYEQSGRRGILRTAPLCYCDDDDMPMGVQIFGSEPETMAKAAKLIATGAYRGFAGKLPSSIDINMGCPVGKVTSNGEGSALLKDPDLCFSIMESVKKAVSIPVSAKIRIGWDHQSINALTVAKGLENAGADFITVHGRTRADLYNPGVNVEVIREVKSVLHIPLIANGDIFTADDALDMFQKTGADGIMIARGALGNPRIFQAIREKCLGGFKEEPDPRERIRMALYHAKSIVQAKGEKIGIPEARKHVAWYTKGMKNSAMCRNRIMRAETFCELSEALEKLLEDPDAQDGR